ncbi:hypothetical protein ABH115_29100 [Mycolicibacterium smegmatis]|uniref:hypothetical protein n=1 Tax=Mycolicibacterium smegmatis TaxID=1772 RepID=UPI003260BD01
MPGALVHALAAPLHDLRTLVGPGWVATDAPVAALSSVRSALTDLAAAAAASWARVSDAVSYTTSDAADE